MSDNTETSSTGGQPGGFNAAGLWQRINDTVRRGEIALALGVVCILVVLILPLPSWMLDISLAISMTYSVLILMTALFIGKALEFSSFPTVLLIATMLRLSLNLASTRLILAHGHEGTDAAGQVIEAFGNFVMSGNFVIGIIVFAILIIVNFVVITKGSGRIAEVSARFSLDAMPGKQMAIDADLSSGLIDENQARDRRKELENESNFFGAMDGAAKFVRGDAIAGLLITFINVIGGIIIGVAQMGLSFGEAAESYTTLTVGDGLVTQIPALIVSTAAGLLISKVASTESADKAIFSQLSNYPKALGLACFLTMALALLPGIPFLPFVLLSALTGTAAWMTTRKHQRSAQQAVDEERQAAESVPVAEEPISNSLAMDQIRLELGYGLLPLLSNEGGSKLTEQIKALRRQLAQELGFILPSVRIQDNLQLPANTYTIKLKEVEVGRGDLRPNMLLIMDPKGETIPLAGEETREPTFGLPAMWVDPGQREEALFRGYTVVDPQTVITTHMTEIIKDNTSDLLSHAETQKLLDNLDLPDQKLVSDLVPAQISVGGIQRVLQNLLAERVSIRDLPSILEGISEATGYTRAVTAITEHVRARLARQISSDNANPDGVVPLVTLSPDWEQAFAESLTGDSDESQLSMPPSQLQEFIAAMRKTFERFAMQGETPALLTSPRVRPYVRSIVERVRPATAVLSQNEIHPKAKIRTLGQL
ncbi:flagellar biosynthesis protein FlhA [Fodinicurvata sediminis]|uniref:flagellar biosynthesis protein FlhA n=1 Tax=Fodinicurvata sediminis TaxID=1121832 RepID=UPI0003B6305E|nr:flagellar biosynthesis protein FlhA [Fodinicurvata sediminis]